MSVDSLDIQRAWDHGEEQGDAAADRFLGELTGQPSVIHALDVHAKLLLEEGKEATEVMTSEERAAYHIASMHGIGKKLMGRQNQA